MAGSWKQATNAGKKVVSGADIAAGAVRQTQAQAENKKLRKPIKKILDAFIKAKNAQLHSFAESNNMAGMPFRLEVTTGDKLFQLHLSIDEPFFHKVFARKLSFQKWLRKEFNDGNIKEDVMYEMMDEYYHLEKLNSAKSRTGQYLKLWRKFNAKEEHGGAFHTQTKKHVRHMKESGRWSLERLASVGTKKKIGTTTDELSRFNYKGNVEKAVTDWIENEKTLFSEGLMFNTEGLGMSPKQQADFKNILKQTATDIQSLFTRVFKNEGVVKEMLEDESSTIAMGEEFQMPDKFDKASFNKMMKGKKLPIKSTPKFPNINRIRDWYLKKDMLFKSDKTEEYLNATPKGKMNFIDSAIFLIGLHIFETPVAKGGIGGKRSQLRGFNKTARYEGGKKSYINKPAMKRARKGRGKERSVQRQNFRKPFSHRTSFRTSTVKSKRKRNT